MHFWSAIPVLQVMSVHLSFNMLWEDSGLLAGNLWFILAGGVCV